MLLLKFLNTQNKAFIFLNGSRSIYSRHRHINVFHII